MCLNAGTGRGVGMAVKVPVGVKVSVGGMGVLVGERVEVIVGGREVSVAAGNVVGTTGVIAGEHPARKKIKTKTILNNFI